MVGQPSERREAREPPPPEEAKSRRETKANPFMADTPAGFVNNLKTLLADLLLLGFEFMIQNGKYKSFFCILYF